MRRNKIATEHIGLGLGAPDHGGLASSDQDGGGPWHGVEVAHGDLLISTSIQHGQDVANFYMRDWHGWEEPVSVATAADDVCLVGEGCIGSVGQQVMVKMVFTAKNLFSEV